MMFYSIKSDYGDLIINDVCLIVEIKRSVFKVIRIIGDI